MARAKPYKPTDYGFNQEAMCQQVNANIKVVVDRYAKGRVARRDFSVFDQLATNGKTVGNVEYPPTLTKGEAVAGNNMFALFAVWKGLGGKPDREYAGPVDEDRVEPDLVTDRMLRAGNKWDEIVRGMKAPNRKLLEALCHDMILADGSMLYTERSPEPETVMIPYARKAEPYEWTGDDHLLHFSVERRVEPTPRPVVRWRRIVQQIAGIKDRDCQRDAIKRMCVDLVKSYNPLWGDA